MKLLECARSSPRPFDAVLVDDTSRLSRNLADAAQPLAAILKAKV